MIEVGFISTKRTHSLIKTNDNTTLQNTISSNFHSQKLVFARFKLSFLLRGRIMQ